MLQGAAGRSAASATSRRVKSSGRPPNAMELPRPSRPRRTMMRRSAIRLGTAAICASEMPAHAMSSQPSSPRQLLARLSARQACLRNLCKCSLLSDAGAQIWGASAMQCCTEHDASSCLPVCGRCSIGRSWALAPRGQAAQASCWAPCGPYAAAARARVLSRCSEGARACNRASSERAQSRAVLDHREVAAGRVLLVYLQRHQAGGGYGVVEESRGQLRGARCCQRLRRRGAHAFRTAFVCCTGMRMTHHVWQPLLAASCAAHLIHGVCDQTQGHIASGGYATPAHE